MSAIRLRSFTQWPFLMQIGRSLLQQLFGTFEGGAAALPAETLTEEAYCRALARRALTPEALPEGLFEALVAIEELATAEGQERLETAVSQAGLGLTFGAESSPGDIAVQVYLAQPALVVREHNETRLGRLTRFEYFGSKRGKADGTHGTDGANCRALALPTVETLEVLASDLDAWFVEHHRGQSMVWIEAQVIAGESHFMVRHGDAFTRTTRVEPRRTHRLHFRPAKDDVVVYAPKREEIRVHAGTKGERELYRRAFGHRLFGDAEYFSEQKAYTGEPLREDCAAALDPRGLPGVRRIVLREVGLAWGRKLEEFMVRGGPDLYASARARGREVIPDYGTIVRAGFDFHFVGEKRPRRVELRMPNTVKLGRHCDPRVIHEWLSARGFRVNVASGRSGEAVSG